MLKDFLNKNVIVTVAFGVYGVGGSAPSKLEGILTECDDKYIKLDDNTIILTNFVLSVVLAN